MAPVKYRVTIAGLADERLNGEFDISRESCDDHLPDEMCCWGFTLAEPGNLGGLITTLRLGFTQSLFVPGHTGVSLYYRWAEGTFDLAVAWGLSYVGLIDEQTYGNGGCDFQELDLPIYVNCCGGTPTARISALP